MGHRLFAPVAWRLIKGVWNERTEFEESLRAMREWLDLNAVRLAVVDIPAWATVSGDAYTCEVCRASVNDLIP